jgi:hypothetical protein
MERQEGYGWVSAASSAVILEILEAMIRFFERDN